MKWGWTIFVTGLAVLSGCGEHVSIEERPNPRKIEVSVVYPEHPVIKTKRFTWRLDPEVTGSEKYNFIVEFDLDAEQPMNSFVSVMGSTPYRDRGGDRRLRRRIDNGQFSGTPAEMRNHTKFTVELKWGYRYWIGFDAESEEGDEILPRVAGGLCQIKIDLTKTPTTPVQRRGVANH